MIFDSKAKTQGVRREEGFSKMIGAIAGDIIVSVHEGAGTKTKHAFASATASATTENCTPGTEPPNQRPRQPLPLRENRLDP